MNVKFTNVKIDGNFVEMPSDVVTYELNEKTKLYCTVLTKAGISLYMYYVRVRNGHEEYYGDARRIPQWVFNGKKTILPHIK